MVIGRDLQADVRVAHPLVSRAHIVLRFDDGRWVAIDNGSLNGMFVDRRRVSSVDIRDGQSINISNPDGPRLTFEVGRHTGAVGRPPSASPARPTAAAAGSRCRARHNSRFHNRRRNPTYATPTQIRPSARRRAATGRTWRRA